MEQARSGRAWTLMGAAVWAVFGAIPASAQRAAPPARGLRAVSVLAPAVSGAAALSPSISAGLTPASALPFLPLGPYVQSPGAALVRGYHGERMRGRNAAIEGRPVDREGIKESREKAVAALSGEFKEDPVFAGRSEPELRRVAKRVTRWTIIDQAEQINVRAAIELERYRAALESRGIRPDGRPESFEAMFDRFGMRYLTHDTPLSNVEDILVSGRLRPRGEGVARNMGGSKDYVYLELPEKRISNERAALDTPERGRFIEDKVGTEAASILLSPAALDRFAFTHANSHWMHGDSSPRHSLTPSNLIAGFLNMIRETDTYDWSLRFASEWMFREALDLRLVDFRVLVPPGEKERIVRSALERGASPEVAARVE